MTTRKSWEEIIQQYLTTLKDVTGAQCLHYGRKHIGTKSNKVKVPEELLTLLWMLRYCIHDFNSLQDFKTFLAPDTFTNTENNGEECSLLTLKSFSLFIINPVVTIATEFIGNKSNFLCEMIRQHYITENDRVKFPKIQEFVYYSTASEMIRIMLHYKADPKFRTDNEHTQIITGILEGSTSLPLKSTVYKIEEADNLYHLFFSSLPYLLFYYQKEHWKLILSKFKTKEKHLNQQSFGKKVNIDNFALSLPVKTAIGTWEAVSLMTFFDKLLNGEDVLAPVIQYITDEERETPISDIVDVEHTAQQHTRKRKPQAKDDNVVIETNTNDDNNSIEINDEEEQNEDDNDEEVNNAIPKKRQRCSIEITGIPPTRKPRMNPDRLTIYVNNDTYISKKNNIEANLKAVITELSNRKTEQILVNKVWKSLDAMQVIFKLIDDARDKKNNKL